MGNLLAGLVRNFLLLRDLFGYAIPGAVVLAAAKRALDFDVSTLPLASDSVWLKAVVFLTASYVIGHVLAAIFFLPWDLYSAQKFFAEWRAAVAQDDTKANTDAAYYRYLYPFMFNEADRRETLTVLRLCLAVSLIVVAFILGFSTRLFPWSLGFGIFMLFNASISRLVAGRSLKTAIKASERAKDDGVAPFNWR
jgi:hypothetical protein